MRSYIRYYPSMFTTHDTSGSDRGGDSESNSTVLIELDSDYNTDTETIDSNDDHSYDDSGSDGGIEYDSIHNEDAFHFYSEKENGKYYIGLCHLYSSMHSNPSTHSYVQVTQWLLSTSVSANSFFRHSYDNINNYLYYYGLVRIPQHEVQIMQVDRLADETCAITIKTHWLRLVQRHWKKTYCKRRNMIRRRKSPQMQQYSQIHGKYPDCISRLPSLRGMLSRYKPY
jgi:hypothetical protein